MQMFVKKVVGKNVYTFVVEGDNLHELTMEAQKLSFYDVPKCGLCGSDDLVLSAHKAGKKDEFSYTDVKCNKCRGSVTFGQKKEDKNVFFLRRTEDKKQLEWKAFVPSAEAA